MRFVSQRMYAPESAYVPKEALVGRTMAVFKVEARRDGASGMWFVELYYPEVLSAPIARTRPIFNGMEQALAGSLRAMRRGLEQAGGLNGVPDFE